MTSYERYPSVNYGKHCSKCGRNITNRYIHWRGWDGFCGNCVINQQQEHIGRQEERTKQLEERITQLEGAVKELQGAMKLMAPAHLRDPLEQAPLKRLKDDATGCLEVDMS